MARVWGGGERREIPVEFWLGNLKETYQWKKMTHGDAREEK